MNELGGASLVTMFRTRVMTSYFLLFRGIECSKICSGFPSKDDLRLSVRQ